MPGLFLTGQKIQGGRGGTIARGRRVTNSAGTTSEAGVLRLDSVAVLAGRAYRIYTTTLVMDGTVNGDQIGAQIRYSASGTATTSSAVLPGGKSHIRQTDAATTEDAPAIVTNYVPSANETLSLLLTVKRFAGTGTVTMIGDGTNIIEMVVEDIGVDPGDTGVDI